MNPEEHLRRTRAPKAPPFLRQAVLDHAERAWHESSGSCRVAKVVFNPLAAAACAALALLGAFLVAEIDDRLTASLVPDARHVHSGEQWAAPVESPAENRPYRPQWLEEFPNGVAWHESAGASGESRPSNRGGT